MECCYIVRQNAITSSDLKKYEHHLARFHQLRMIFIETGVRTSFSLPRQHALLHFVDKIELFGSPNGVCSSITESRHIKAVKEPWRRSSRYKATAQMVRTISRLDKLHSIGRIFEDQGMMEGSLSTFTAAVAAGYPPPIRLLGADSEHFSESESPNDDDSDDDDDGGPSSSPYTLAQVTLASKPGRYIYHPCFF